MRHKQLIWAGALTCLMAFAGSAQSQTRLRVVPHDEPTIFDPVTAVAAISQQHAYMVYDTLFSFDANGKPQPQMVETVTESNGGRTLSMTLRSGLKFHDGTPVQAKDAVASINRWAKRDVVGTKLVAMGMKLTVKDERTFVVDIDQPTSLVLEGFAKPTSSALFVMREADANNEPTKAVTANIGSGPFRFVQSEYLSGSRLVYERNHDYVPRSEPASGFAGGKVVHFDRVEFDIMPDAATAAASLQTGSIDIFERPPLDLLPLFASNKQIVTRALNKDGFSGILRFNFQQPPFDNVKARQAVLAAFDQSEFMELASGGDSKVWRTCYSFLACTSQVAIEDGTEAVRKPDIAKAKQLLKEAGYSGQPVHLMQPTNFPLVSGFVEVAAARLREVGFNVNLVPLDWATLLQRRANKGTFAEGGWTAFITWGYAVDLVSPATNFLLNTPCNGSGWFGWPCEDTLNGLRDAWMRSASPDERNSLLHQIQSRSAEFVPFVPLGQYQQPVSYRSNLTGLLDTPVAVFWNVQKQ